MNKTKHKKFIKTFIKIILSLILFSGLVAICDYCAYKAYFKIYTHDNKKLQKFHWELITNKEILKKHAVTFKNDTRKPEGLKFANQSKHSITIFGCSLTYGSYLKTHQTLSYKLSNILKVPVYNKALPATGVQEMWYLTGAEGAKDTNNIALSDTYIYFIMNDHYRRLYTLTKTRCSKKYLNYIDKKGNLKNKLQLNPISTFLKTTYTYQLIESTLTDKYINDPKNEDEIINRVVLYVKGSKNALEERYNKKINFIVVIWDKTKYKEKLKEKLENNGITAITTDELTKENLMSLNYVISEDNDHPNEKTWDLIAPLLAEKIKKIWQETD